MIGPQWPRPSGQLRANGNHPAEQESPGARQQLQVRQRQSVQIQSRPRHVPVTSLQPTVEPRVGGGAVNLGNTCFLASVLQCLAHCPVIHSALNSDTVDGLHGFSGKCPLAAQGVVCRACLLTDALREQLASARGNAVRHSALIRNLPLFAKSFRRGRQQDSHELLLALLEGVEVDSKKAAAILGLPKANHSLIEQMFCGQLLSRVKCEVCGYCSDSYQALTSLSVDLGRNQDLQASLVAYQSKETLYGANAYRCDQCKQLVRAQKSLLIWDQPNVLCVHLKRFDGGSKCTRHLVFPLELHLSGQGLGYKLVGVAVHSGFSPQSGHYYAYVCDGSGQWTECNDSSVYPVGVKEVLKSQAYLLFYSRAKFKEPAIPPKAPDTTPATTPASAVAAPGMKREASVYGPMPLPAAPAPVYGPMPAPAPAAAPVFGPMRLPANFSAPAVVHGPAPPPTTTVLQHSSGGKKPPIVIKLQPKAAVLPVRPPVSKPPVAASAEAGAGEGVELEAFQKKRPFEASSSGVEGGMPTSSGVEGGLSANSVAGRVDAVKRRLVGSFKEVEMLKAALMQEVRMRQFKGTPALAALHDEGMRYFILEQLCTAAAFKEAEASLRQAVDNDRRAHKRCKL